MVCRLTSQLDYFRVANLPLMWVTSVLPTIQPELAGSLLVHKHYYVSVGFGRVLQVEVVVGLQAPWYASGHEASA
jgi:hypothetical protein